MKRTNAQRKTYQFFIVDRDKRSKTDASDSEPPSNLQTDAHWWTPSRWSLMGFISECRLVGLQIRWWFWIGSICFTFIPIQNHHWICKPTLRWQTPSVTSVIVHTLWNWKVQHKLHTVTRLLNSREITETCKLFPAVANLLRSSRTRNQISLMQVRYHRS